MDYGLLTAMLVALVILWLGKLLSTCLGSKVRNHHGAVVNNES